MKKAVKVLTTAALLASLAAPFAVPVSAATDYRIGELTTFSDDQDTATLASLTFKEDSDFLDELKPGGTITLTFPSGAKLKSNVADMVTLNGVKVTDFPGGKVEKSGDYTLNIVLPEANATYTDANNVVTKAFNDTTGPNKAADSLVITPVVELDDFAGTSVDVTVESLGAGVPSGKYTLAKVAKGDTVTTTIENKTIGENGGKIGTIRIEEASAGTIGTKPIKVKLPKGFTWRTTSLDPANPNNKTNVSVLGGLNVTKTLNVQVDANDDRTLVITPSNTGQNTTAKGYIQVEAWVNVNTKDAKFGDIEVEVSGDDVDTASVNVGKYADFGVSVKADGDAKEIVAGRDGSDDDDAKLQTIIIKEDVANSFAANRKTKVEFPSSVKIVKVEAKGDFATTGVWAANAVPTNVGTVDENEFEFQAPTGGTSKKELKLTFYVVAKADFKGDVVAKISGRGGIEGEALVGKVLAPVTVTAESKDVKVGVKGQAIGDITLVESKKEALVRKKKVEVKLSDDVKWTTEPTVEVVDGNLEIDKDSIDVVDNTLSFEIKSESTKPSKIVIKNAKVDLNRSIPEGQITAKVGGEAVVQNNGSNSAYDKFDKDNIGEFVVAKVITPAPGDVTNSNVVFKLNSKTFTVDGKAQEMDAAPLVGWDRAFLPVRFAANALNVSDSNIIWDDKTSTFTIFKGDRVITGKVGDKFLTVNGVKVPMDVPVWRNKAQTNNRVMVPIRYLANALNANIEWNKETSEITISAAK